LIILSSQGLVGSCIIENLVSLGGVSEKSFEFFIKISVNLEELREVDIQLCFNLVPRQDLFELLVKSKDRHEVRFSQL